MVDLRLALRSLTRSPFVTGVAVLSLSLGIGANAAIFSLFDQLLLRPLPVHEPGRLVNLGAPGPKPGSNSCNQAGDCEDVFSYPMFRDLERTQVALQGLAAHTSFDANLATEERTEHGEGMMVSGSYFPTLGLTPALGRLLGPEDDRGIGSGYVVVLSHSFWSRELGADPSVIGQPLKVNGQSMTIVGVAPRGFEGTTLGVRPRVFVPISMREQMIPGWKGFDNRRSYWVYLFGRLRPGSSMEQAAASLNAVYRPIITDVEAPLQEGMSDQAMALFRDRAITLAPGARGQSWAHAEARTPMSFLLGITVVVLLIACANIANLLLARSASRNQEMAVRLSLGASRTQVMAQLLAESCLLAVMGGVVSLVVARWTLAGISAILPDQTFSTISFHLDMRMMLLTGALAMVTGLLFGIFPALHATRPDIITTIRATAGQLSGSRSAGRFRSTLVTAQIALSMTLLVSAGLFLRSLMNVSRVGLGLDAENVVSFTLSPELNGYDPTRSRQLFQQATAELEAMPGVTGVTGGVVPLLAGYNWGQDVSVQGFERLADADVRARFNEVAPRYFSVLGMRLIAGREFTEADVAGAQKVAVVNETFARKFGLGNDAVGKYMAVGGSDSLDIQIVGLARDASYSRVKEDVPPMFFLPYQQDSTVGGITLYVRTSSDPEPVLRAIPGLIHGLDPSLPVEQLKTLPMQVRENVFLDRMISTLSVSFAMLATLLAAVGLYGVLAYTVAQRTREIGVRMALGADAGSVRRMVLGQVGWMLMVGIAIGAIAALGVGRLVGSLLYGLAGHDPLVMVLSVVALSAVALGAAYLPARRASRVDPVRALRYG